MRLYGLGDVIRGCNPRHGRREANEGEGYEEEYGHRERILVFFIVPHLY